MITYYIYDRPVWKSSIYLWDLKKCTTNILDANNLNWFQVEVSRGVKKIRKLVSVLVRSRTCKWLEFFSSVYLLISVSFIFSPITDIYFTETIKNGLMRILTLAAEFFFHYNNKLQTFSLRWPQLRDSHLAHFLFSVSGNTTPSGS